MTNRHNSASGSSITEKKDYLFNTRKRFKVSDIMSRAGQSLDIPDDQISLDDTLIRGNFYQKELRKGLSLHGGDAIEEHAFTANSSIGEGLSCIFFLKGEVDITIGDHKLGFKIQDKNMMEMAAVFKTSQERFSRVTKHPQHVKHLVITASQEWLNSEGFEEAYGICLSEQFHNKQKTCLPCYPSPRLCELVGEILEPSVFMPELLNLYLESRVIEVITEIISTMMQASRRVNKGFILTRHDNIRLQRARELISTNLGKPLSVELIAHEAGISTSGLQRLFRQTEGLSVFEYVRQIRLNQALSTLQTKSASVQEASAIAGYSNPANFATAFKRQFGITPREVSRQGYSK